MADDSLTILARLVAEDKASAAVNKVDKSLDKLDTNAKKASSGMKKFGDASADTRGRLTKLDVAITGAATAFAGLQIVRWTSELYQHGEQVRRVTNTYNALTGSAQQADRTLESLRQRTRGMISDTELMAAANDLLGGNIAKSSEEAVRLIGLANDLGASTEQLFSVLANQSIEVLDSFKVSSGAVRQLRQDFIDAGMASDEAFKEAFLIEADKAVERLGDSIEENVSPTEQLTVRWTNFWDKVAETSAVILNNAVTTAEQVAFIIDHMAGPDDFAQDLLNSDWFNTLMSMTPMGGAFGQARQQMLDAQNAAGRAGNLQSTLDAMVNVPMSGGAQAIMAGGREAVGAGLDVLQGAMGAFQDIGARLPDAMDAATKAAEEQARATEENTRALRDQAQSISDSIARMMGWEPAEQRELEGAQRTVRDALQRAGLSEDEMDAVMSRGQGRLERNLASGMTPAEAAMRAYNVQDPTPGVGRDAVYTGGAPTAGGYNPLASPWMAAYGRGDQRNAMGASNLNAQALWMQSALLGSYNTPQQVGGGGPMGAGTIWGDMAFQQQNAYRGMAQGIMGAPGELMNQGGALVQALTTAFTNALNQYGPRGQMNAMGAGSVWDDLNAQTQAQTGNFAVAPEENLGATNFGFLQTGLELMRGSIETLNDEEHFGGWDDRVTEATSEVDRMRLAVDNLVGRRRTLDVDVRINQNAYDALTNVIFNILRGSGLNLGSRQGGSGRPF